MDGGRRGCVLETLASDNRILGRDDLCQSRILDSTAARLDVVRNGTTVLRLKKVQSTQLRLTDYINKQTIPPFDLGRPIYKTRVTTPFFLAFHPIVSLYFLASLRLSYLVANLPATSIPSLFLHGGLGSELWIKLQQQLQLRLRLNTRAAGPETAQEIACAVARRSASSTRTSVVVCSFSTSERTLQVA